MPSNRRAPPGDHHAGFARTESKKEAAPKGGLISRRRRAYFEAFSNGVGRGVALLEGGRIGISNLG